MTIGRRRGLLLAAGLATLLAGPPARALAQNDQQTEDQADQDRRYLERLRERQKAKDSASDASDESAERVRKFVAEADRLVRDQNYSSRITDHYRAMTDDPRVDIAATGDLLESFRSFFESFWAGRAKLRPYPERSSVYLFYSQYKYKQLWAGGAGFDEYRPSGDYKASLDVVLIHSDSVPAPELPDLLVHEAAHQMVEQRLFGPAGSRSLWVGEGLAVYFGNTLRESDGSFRAGKVGGKGIALIRKSPKGGGRQAQRSIDLLRKTLKKDPGWSLDALVRAADPSVFYGSGAEERYAASWLLVHYLLHGEGGTRAPAFVRYLGREAEGKGGADALYECLGIEPSVLKDGFARYVAGIGRE